MDHSDAGKARAVCVVKDGCCRVEVGLTRLTNDEM